MNKFMGHKMKRKMEGSGAKRRGLKSSVQFFIVRTLEEHTKALRRFN